MTLIRRDSFARTELHRTFISRKTLPPGLDCAWCGMKTRRGGLFRYRTESDGGRSHEDKKLFCSVDCRTSYYA